MDMKYNVIRRLTAVAEKFPDRAALVRAQGDGLPDHLMTFGGLEKASAGYGRFFLSRGLTDKDIALLLMPPGLAFYALFLALARIGVPVMLVDPGVGMKHFAACVRQVPPTVFIAPPKGHLLRLRPGFSGPLRAFSPSFVPFATTLKELPPEGMRGSGAAADGGDHVPGGAAAADGGDHVPGGAAEGSGACGSGTAAALAEEHPALITFTSGSTGRPKAIMRTHGFLLRQGDALAKLMPAEPDDVEFCSFPVFTLANLARGVTTLLPPSGGRMADAAACITRHAATRLLASPDFCDRLCREGGEGLARLRAVHTGGGPVQLRLLDRLAASAPGAKILSLYGSTEAEPIALQSLADIPEEWRRRVRGGGGLPAGPPVGGISLRVIRDNGGRAFGALAAEEFSALCLPAGGAGEIVVSGPLVQKGYLNPADDAETKITVGDTVWHRTGDAGVLDADGALWLLGRCSAKITVGGLTVYPFAVEAAACLHPAVCRAALVRVRETTILAVEGEALSDEDCAGLLREFTVLDKVMPLPRIPVDTRHNSKVLYGQLRAELEKLKGPL